MALTLSVHPGQPEDAPLVLAAEVLQAGGVIVYPTETLYGIGAHALDEKAIKRVQMLKGRTARKPILVIVPTVSSVLALTRDQPPVAEQLMQKFWPGSVTLIFHASSAVPEELTEGAGTIGIRIPSSKLCLRLLELAGLPITSTSANISGEPVLHSIPEIKNVFSSGVDLYLDGGTITEIRPSSVVDLTSSPPRLIREGAVPLDRLREVVPDILW